MKLTDLVLQRRLLDLDDALDLVGQIGLDVLLQATEKEGAQNLVQPADDEQRLLLVERDLILAARAGEWRIEPLVERLGRVEDGRQDKVEQRPELGQVVLRGQSRPLQHRRTCSGVPVRMRRKGAM